MDVFNSLESIGRRAPGRTVATLGTFDGVHVGHQALIRETVAWAAALGADPVVVTFDRHPRSVLTGGPFPCLTTLPHRLRLFEALGVRDVLVLAFDREMASWEAEEFVRRVFGEGLRAAGVLLGFNCRFGKGRRGDAALLAKEGAAYGFAVRAAPPVEINGTLVSSTWIRQAVQTGDLDAAEAMLGRKYSLFGTVVTGDRRGRILGFPTANLDPAGMILVPRGVYATSTTAEGRAWPSVTNIGHRPTFGGEKPRERVETHLIGFSGDLVGRDIEVVFRRWIRDERAFPSSEALRTQIARDAAAAGQS
ncbi:MAG: riboflavin biosynthesis protein RibF [Planctomycetota bacterium]